MFSFGATTAKDPLTGILPRPAGQGIDLGELTLPSLVPLA
jgi:hypothetical protein